jgi:hypothetical protein
MIALALAALAASAPVPDYTDAIAYADGRVLYAERAFGGKPLVLRERLPAGGTRDDEYIASGKLRLRPSRRVQRVRMRLDERTSGRMKVYLGELNGSGPRTVKISAQR